MQGKENGISFFSSQEAIFQDHEIPPKLLVLDGTFLGGGWEIFDPVEILSFYEEKKIL